MFGIAVLVTENVGPQSVRYKKELMWGNLILYNRLLRFTVIRHEVENEVESKAIPPNRRQPFKAISYQFV